MGSDDIGTKGDTAAVEASVQAKEPKVKTKRDWSVLWDLLYRCVDYGGETVHTCTRWCTETFGTWLLKMTTFLVVGAVCFGAGMLYQDWKTLKGSVEGRVDALEEQGRLHAKKIHSNEWWIIDYHGAPE